MDYINQTIRYVKQELAGAEAGHDWFHIERVYKNALQILQDEPANQEVVILGALLHDIADSKFHNGNEDIGPEKADAFMTSIGIDEEVKNHVVKIIQNISFKGGNFQQQFSSLELNIVQDADRLDALGAIGVARAFHFGGFHNRIIYDPMEKPRMNMSKEEYKKHIGTTINHFDEKLLRLKDMMNTLAGKKIAEHRHQFMKQFLEQFYAEWNGER
ncbi:HD domain-containing protein [Avrilella dinanensis]|uniref:Phosphohydrolase n=1 Tax=Avrilella dinanensis TaxID=2008672 RepID=A0A2M9R2Y0_9FLAO|nr:HD domain-containing protein [Avrilella dinanensis]PJR03083.1 phosphohydrolase [Avrilella dinanensis]